MMENLRENLVAHMKLLKKNKEAISVNGHIPAKYAKAYNKKVGTMYTMLDEYVFKVVTGCWWLGDNEQEQKPFVDAYRALIAANENVIGQAIKRLDIESLDNAIIPLNEKFEREMLDYHIETMKRKCRQITAAS